MATAAAAKTRDVTFVWEGKDKAGKVMRGEMRAGGQAVVNATLRRQGILVTKVKKQRMRRGGKVTSKDIALFTRQLATMMKAGVPLLQSFEIVLLFIVTAPLSAMARPHRISAPVFSVMD